jgi:hypothetical protein
LSTAESQLFEGSLQFLQALNPSKGNDWNTMRLKERFLLQSVLGSMQTIPSGRTERTWQLPGRDGGNVLEFKRYGTNAPRKPAHGIKS